jgi:hypothetical protein
MDGKASKNRLFPYRSWLSNWSIVTLDEGNNKASGATGDIHSAQGLVRPSLFYTRHIHDI